MSEPMTNDQALKKALKDLANLQLKNGYILGLVPDVIIGKRAKQWCVYAINCWPRDYPEISRGDTEIEAIAKAKEELADCDYGNIPRPRILKMTSANDHQEPPA